jgi:alkylhydroperoxidase/carboxymuconolactone decarboxylase family protein YurZ
MPGLPGRYFNGRKTYAHYFAETHAAGDLDAKTKELMHLALVLAFDCEPER